MNILPKWMRFILAMILLPCAFLTEYFLVAQWLHVIHVSYWFMVYTVLADAGNGKLFLYLINGPKPETK